MRGAQAAGVVSVVGDRYASTVCWFNRQNYPRNTYYIVKMRSSRFQRFLSTGANLLGQQASNVRTRLCAAFVVLRVSLRPQRQGMVQVVLAQGNQHSRTILQDPSLNYPPNPIPEVS